MKKRIWTMASNCDFGGAALGTLLGFRRRRRIGRSGDGAVPRCFEAANADREV